MSGPFRKAALERLSTPERLDELVLLIPSRGWLLLAGAGAALVAVILWFAFGA
jgi:HlyD family secretion protein